MFVGFVKLTYSFAKSPRPAMIIWHEKWNRMAGGSHFGHRGTENTEVELEMNAKACLNRAFRETADDWRQSRSAIADLSLG
jgi:hypothetical protein